VLATCRAALSINNAERQAAEAALQGWEQDAAPGFVSALIRIVEEHAAIDEVMCCCAVCCLCLDRKRSVGLVGAENQR
jgi:hypothetical protein